MREKKQLVRVFADVTVKSHSQQSHSRYNRGYRNMWSGWVDDNLSDVLECYTGRNESTTGDDSEEHEKDISQLELQNSGIQSDFFHIINGNLRSQNAYKSSMHVTVFVCVCVCVGHSFKSSFLGLLDADEPAEPCCVMAINPHPRPVNQDLTPFIRAGPDDSISYAHWNVWPLNSEGLSRFTERKKNTTETHRVPRRDRRRPASCCNEGFLLSNSAGFQATIHL